MAILQIGCINKQDRDDPYERILRVGGLSNMVAWRKSQKEAINDIETGTNQFYVQIGLQRVNVIVRISRFNNKYITTEPDGESQNNLLSLPECG